MTQTPLAVHHSFLVLRRVLAVGTAVAATSVLLGGPAAALPVPPRADVALTITDSADPVVAGGSLTYTLTVTNLGPAKASHPYLRIDFPERELIRSTSSGSCDSEGCTLADLGVRQSAIVTVRMKPPAPGSVSMLAFLGSDTDDPDTSNNRAEERTRVLGPDLQTSLRTLPERVVAGQDFELVLTATNVGPMVADAVVLRTEVHNNTIHPGLIAFREARYGDCTTVQENADWLVATHGVVDKAECRYPSLAPGRSVTMTVRYTALQPTLFNELVLQAASSASPGDMNWTDNGYGPSYLPIAAA